MDYVVALCSFIAGCLSYYVFFGGSRPGPFEESLMTNLMLGKRVIVSIDEDCYIFEMHDGKMRITRGISTYLDESYEEKPELQ